MPDGQILRFTEGDATVPGGGAGAKTVAHVCNDAGGWGRGFVLALSRRSPEPERAYRTWYRARARNDFALGAVQFVPFGPKVRVANMIAQHGVRRRVSDPPPIRYDALESCLRLVADEAEERAASVHMPRIGCGLAGGDWSRVEALVGAVFAGRGVQVTVYDPPGAGRSAAECG